MRLFILIFLVFGCGREPHVVEKYPDTPNQPPPDDDNNTGDLSYGEMQALLNNYCAACHSTAGFMQSEAALRNSGVKDQLWSRRMPPSNAPKQLPDKERSDMISFF